MSAFAECKICGQYDWLAQHRCPPVWQVEVDGSGCWHEVHAADAEAAAERACEEQDEEGDYYVIRNGSAKVLVRRAEADEPEEFFVEAESRPHYMARKVET